MIGGLVKLVQEQELLHSIYLLYWYKSANTDAEAGLCRCCNAIPPVHLRANTLVAGV